MARPARVRVIHVFAAFGLLGLACRTVPAELPLTPEGSEPARTGKVFVEAQPERRELPAGSFGWISDDITGLYRCWFRNPYE